jgi:hypothetical protein
MFKSREDEYEELSELLHSKCMLGVPGGIENKHGKVNILMQSNLSRAKIDSFSLVSDSMFVMQVCYTLNTIISSIVTNIFSFFRTLIV